jgi:hypothetical protein
MMLLLPTDPFPIMTSLTVSSATGPDRAMAKALLDITYESRCMSNPLLGNVKAGSPKYGGNGRLGGIAPLQCGHLHILNIYTYRRPLNLVVVRVSWFSGGATC